jgi:hypothetical protein
LASMRLTDNDTAARVLLGLGWLLLLAALAATFGAQARVGRVLAAVDDRLSAADVTRTLGGQVAPWLVVAGLASVAVGVLLT